jgi:hypothetical protein
MYSVAFPQSKFAIHFGKEQRLTQILTDENLVLKMHLKKCLNRD